MSGYRFSADANRDVAGIVDFLFELNPVAARNFLNALESTCELLAAHSGIGRLRPELGEGVRSMPIGNYLVFYIPSAEGIDVARVIYGGRDLPAVFRRQE
jgi:toxin ParE1/3/4